LALVVVVVCPTPNQLGQNHTWNSTATQHATTDQRLQYAPLFVVVAFSANAVVNFV
jgi:hypothetical protein